MPVFLVINGYFFFSVLARDGQISWFKRVFILYAVWMLFYSYFWFSMPEASISCFVKLAIYIIIGYWHLWYISGMLGAAIMLLILRRFSSSFLSSTILIFFLVGVFIQYLGNYHYFEGSTLDKLLNVYWFHRNMVFFSYPFFCVGYLIHKHSIHEKITLKFAGALSILGVLSLLGESYLNFYHEGGEGGFDNYLSLLLTCPFIFILFIKFTISGNSKTIALYSSAIYFIHIFFLIIFHGYTKLGATFLTIATIIASIVSSYFIIKINKKVKYIL